MSCNMWIDYVLNRLSDDVVSYVEITITFISCGKIMIEWAIILSQDKLTNVFCDIVWGVAQLKSIEPKRLINDGIYSK